MEGILILVLWIITILLLIGTYIRSEHVKKMVENDGMSEKDNDVKNHYGSLRIMTFFAVVALVVIIALSFLEASETENYFKF